MRTPLLVLIAPTVAFAGAIIIALYVSSLWFWPLLVISVLLSYVGQYYSIYIPTIRVAEEGRTAIIQCILNDMFAQLPTGKNKECMLRLNVMEIKAEKWKKHLSMCACVKQYSPAEKDLMWYNGQGCCGMAWKQRKQIFAATSRSYPANTMTSDQKDICRQVKCTLSTPILSKSNKVVGVLNVDSTRSNARIDAKVEDIAQVYADIISELY